jgi:methanogenic corrinoid protein MtbC1/hemoglobin-like flavoprotein
MSEQQIHLQASESVGARRTEIIEALVEREFARHPELEARYGSVAREKSLQDAGYHVSFLAQALNLDNQAVFTDYVAWAKIVLTHRKVAAADFAFHLECLADVLKERIPGAPGALAAEFVLSAVQAMPAMPDELPTFLHDNEPLSPLAHQYLEALQRGERHAASRLVLDAVGAGTSVKDIYLRVFQPAQYEIGRLWQANRMTVAQEHYCTAATQLIMSQLYSRVFAGKKIGQTLVATCVAGDLHELGVRMVSDFFEMDGWNTYYVGANVPHQSVIAAIVERDADVLAISATLSFHVESVRQLIHAVRQHPIARHVKVLTGGYPFNQSPDLWKQVGADGYAPDANRALTLANELQRERRPIAEEVGPTKRDGHGTAG